MSRSHLRRSRMALLVTLPAVGLVSAVAIMALLRAGGGGSSAFAEAAAGTYAVAFRNDGPADTVLAVSVADGSATEIAQLHHIEGYTSFGAVAPDGSRLAAVVADAGTPARPAATLHVVDLASGSKRTLVSEIDQLQQPVWSQDSASVYVTRTTKSDDAAPRVAILRVSVGGADAMEVMALPGVAGAYPVGFDADGRLLVAAITEEGSLLYRESDDPIVISRAVTRDWRVSPDGTQVGFIEADLADGVRYRFALVDLAGGSRAQTGASEGQQLGVAWEPSGRLAVGEEPGSGASRASSSGSPGFDIPLSYSPDGVFLAVEAWTGSSFSDPGTASLAVVGAGGRTTLTDANRFAGWSTR